MDKNIDEFRFVITNNTINNFKVDPRSAVDFIDFYINRKERVRLFKTGVKKNKFFYIKTIPGRITKNSIEIDEEKAKKMASINNVELIVKKTGIGSILIDGKEGYIERVQVEHVRSKKLILDEVHIEFELPYKDISILRQKINPIRVIEVGLYDYISTKNKPYIYDENKYTY